MKCSRSDNKKHLWPESSDSGLFISKPFGAKVNHTTIMRLNIVPTIMAIACVIGVILSLDFASQWRPIEGLHVEVSRINYDFYFMAAFFAICGMFFLSVSVKREQNG